MDGQPQLDGAASADLLRRGYNRRDLGRIAALLGVGAAVAKPAWAAAAPGPVPKVMIDSNECWTGPMEPGQAAARAIIARSNRYEPGNERDKFIAAVMKADSVPADHVSPWPGSSDPLSRAVVTFASPQHGLVTADPTFELAWTTAEYLGVPIRKVPLTADYRHDVKAMLAADPQAGLFYVCSPNNPTGTITPLEDILWLVRNKPAGAKVLVDEAYIHFAGIPSATALFSQSKDVVVLRTFSKLFGMAGMRMGYALSDPANIAAMQRYDGDALSGSLPLPSLACATASLGQTALIAQRRAFMQNNLAFVTREVERRGFKVIPSRANMFMIDWNGRPAKQMREAIRKQGVEIGRSWAIWPNVSRVTVSSRGEMIAFLNALDRAIKA